MAREKSEKYAELLAAEKKAEEQQHPKKENSFVKAGQNLKGAKDNIEIDPSKKEEKPIAKKQESSKSSASSKASLDLVGDKKQRRSALKGILKDAKKKSLKKSQSYYLKVTNIENLEKYGKSRGCSASEVLDALLDELFE